MSPYFGLFGLYYASIYNRSKPQKYRYRILPNKGAGRSSEVTFDSLGTKLRFWAFQRWFRIEKRTIFKETVLILVRYDRAGFLQTIGGALIRGGALNWQIMENKKD